MKNAYICDERVAHRAGQVRSAQSAPPAIPASSHRCPQRRDLLRWTCRTMQREPRGALLRLSTTAMIAIEDADRKQAATSAYSPTFGA